MNCRPGDLAIFVKSEAGNEGRIVRCIRLMTASEIISGNWFSDLVWVTDVAVRSTYGDGVFAAMDECLRPIRPGDISDEEVRDLYAPKVPEAA